MEATTTEAPAITEGTPVELLINAGLIRRHTDTRFVATAAKGTRGRYLGPHPSMDENDWHLISVVIDECEDCTRTGETLLAPLHSGHFAVVSTAEIDTSTLSGPRVSNSADHS